MNDNINKFERVFTQGDTLLETKLLNVKSNSQLLITASVEAYETVSGKNPAAIALRFFKDGVHVEDLGKIDGLSESDTLGYFAYIGERGCTGKIDFKKRITIPDDVTHLGATIVAWRAPVISITEGVQFTPLIEEDDELWSSSITVHEVTELGLKISLDIVGGQETRAPALAALTFLDADGKQVTSLPRRLRVSKKHGPYVYVGQPGDEGRQDFDLHLPVPRGAARVAMRLLRWGAERISLVAAPEISLQQVERASWPESLLAEIDIPVRQGETYDLVYRHSTDAVMGDGFALLRPTFLDANGWRVAPADKLPVSDKMGPFRYFERSGTGEDGVPTARTNLSIPADAVRLKAEIHRWRLQDDPGEVTVEAICLGDDKSISQQGQLAYASDNGRVVFQGKLRIEGPLRRIAGVMEWLFENEQGERITLRAAGLASTDRFLNCSTFHCHRNDGVIYARARFIPPAGTHRIRWRLRPQEGITLATLADFSWSFAQDTVDDAVRKLPPAARTSADIDEDRCTQLRSTIATADFWKGVFGGTLDLQGEAVTACTPNDWLEVSARIATSPEAGRPPVIIRPTFFDAEGTPINGANQPGCRLGKNLGFVRNAAVAALAGAGGGANLREAFLAPADAAFATFHVASSRPWLDTALQTIDIATIAPDDVLVQFDTTIMDRPHLVDATEVADSVRNLPARHALAIALASLEKKDPKPAHRAKALGEELRELSPQWLPPVPPCPPRATDPQSILHLFKVIYPDESSGGAVRSTSIVEAQAARGLHPVVCMPLNSPRPSAPLPDRDGIETVERNGVQVCYPHYPGLISKKMARTDLLSLETLLAGRVIREQRVSLIHAASGFRGYELALKGIALAQAHDLPLVYEVRSFHEHTWKPISMPQISDGITHLRMAQENRCMAAADAVVTISQAMMHNLRERGVPDDRLFFVPNAIDRIFETRPSHDAIEALRAAQGLLGKKTIGYISNFAEREGHIVLLDAFTRLVAAGHDLHLVLVGDGPQRASIIEQVGLRGLAERVVMPGNVDHTSVRTWYHTIDLFVVPRVADFASDYVTPLKPFEAMAQNIPVLMSDRPVSAEIAGSAQERASIFPAGDDEALAGLIAATLADPGRLQARTERAHTWVMAERLWSNVAERYDEAYETARRMHALRPRMAS